MYKVIGHPRSRASRVIWMLEELETEYEIVPAAPHSDEIKALNPTGKVPALRDGETVVIDSVAICQYLADKHGQFTHKAGTPDRAHQDSFTQFAMGDGETPLWTAAKNTFALPEERRVPEIEETCRWEFANAMRALEERLGDGPYVTGEMFTVPDLLLGHCAGWASNTNFDVPKGKVDEYFARVRERPALARALERGEAATPQ